MINTLKAIAEIISAFGTLIIAGIVAYIAYRQHRTEKSRLNLDLYERRIKIFQSGMEYISYIAENGDVDGQKLSSFNHARLDGLFLFPTEINEYLTTLYDKGVDLQTLNMELNNLHLLSADDSGQKPSDRGELLKWFFRQLKELQSRLRPHIGFD